MNPLDMPTRKFVVIVLAFVLMALACDLHTVLAGSNPPCPYHEHRQTEGL